MIDRNTNIQGALRSRQRGFLLNPFRFGGVPAPSDPYFANVSLLLHMDGPGSTTFTDSSGTPKTVTANGSAQKSTLQSKFGGSSLLLYGPSSDYLSIPSSSAFDFGSGDFTIEMFVRLVTVVGGYHIIGKYQTSAASPFAIYQNGGQIGFYSSSNGSSWDLISNLSFGSSFSTFTWYHLAVARESNTWRTFRDGLKMAEATASGSVFSSAESVMIGRGANVAPTYLSGNIDELRITKGVARYTGDFTPPTAPFPNS